MPTLVRPLWSRVGDTERELAGSGDPQTMRMLLLQILTGRRVSEICICEFDCLLPATARAVEAAGGEQVARFRYAQSKVDRAPDTILVDAEVVTIIEEQQQAVRARYPRFGTSLFVSSPPEQPARR